MCNNFNTLNLNELETINGGFSWRDVATAGGTMLGGAVGTLIGPEGTVIGAGVGSVVGGAVYDSLT